MVIFPIDQVPEMTRGRGVRLQRYKEKGLSDVTTFKADDGLTWTDSAGRTQTLTMKELKDWRGNRADAGRIAQGLPKNNKFRGTPSARQRRRRAKNDAKTAASTRHEQQRTLRFFQQRGRGVAEEKLLAGPAADAHHDQIVCLRWDLLEDGFVGGDVGAHRGAHVVS